MSMSLWGGLRLRDPILADGLASAWKGVSKASEGWARGPDPPGPDRGQEGAFPRETACPVGGKESFSAPPSLGRCSAIPGFLRRHAKIVCPMKLPE